MNYQKRINGIVLRLLFTNYFAVFILLFFIFVLSFPFKTSAQLDWSLKILDFAKNSAEAGERIGEIREGEIKPEVEQQLKDTSRWDELQDLMLDFPDERDQKALRGLFTYENELSNPDSLFRKELVGSGVDVVVGSYKNPSLGLSDDLPPALEDVARPWWLRAITKIKDIGEAIKTFLGNSKKESNEQPAQISEAVNNVISDNEQGEEPTQEQPSMNEPMEENENAPITQPQTQQNTQTQATGGEKTSASILVVNQFNEPVERARIWLEDERGKTYPSSSWFGYWDTDKVGRLFFSYDEKGEIPNGKFNINIEKENYSPIKENISMSFSPTAVVISSYKFVLRKLPIVSGILLDASGEPAIHKIYKAASDSTGGYTPMFRITSSDGRVIADEYDIHTDSRTGRFESEPLPPGHYLLKVWIPGGYNTPEFVMATKELDISYDQKEVWLGKIIINGIPADF